MKPLKPIFAPSAGTRVAKVSEMRAAGNKRWRLYADDVSRPLRGVVSEPGLDPEGPETRLTALRRLMSPGCFLSRRTAARELEIPINASERLLEVGAVRPKKAPTRAGMIRAHQLGPGVLRDEPGPPLWLPHPADVWGLLAGVCGVDELVAAGDFLISGRNRWAEPLCVFADLEDALRRFRGCRGAGVLSEALRLVRTGVESPAETSTRLLVVRAGFAEPTTCCPVPTDLGVFFADLGYPELKIAIEYDGAPHFTGEDERERIERARRDNTRIEAMIDAGWRVLRLTAVDLRDPRGFIARLGRAIAEARSGR